jgi:ABC-type phosphate/phosphonate transport system ATPase subunit
MGLFLDTAERTGTTVLMVSHDVNLVKEFNFREIKTSSSKTDDNGTLSVIDDLAGFDTGADDKTEAGTERSA